MKCINYITSNPSRNIKKKLNLYIKERLENLIVDINIIFLAWIIKTPYVTFIFNIFN